MKKMFLITATLISFSALAQTPVETAPASTSTMAAPQIQKPSSVLNNIILGYKSMNDTGRFGYTNANESRADADAGRKYKGKHELKLGAKLDSGWGAYGTMTQYRYAYNAPGMTRWSVSDPSATLTMPKYISTDKLSLSGSLRYYFPLGNRSKGNGTQQYSYYLDSNYKMSGTAGEEVFNSFNPRIFAQAQYAAGDTRVKIEDITSYTRKINSYSRWGFGQWTQFEQHSTTKDGLTVDAFVQYDLMYNAKTFVGPRIYAPVFVNNVVFDGAKQASWENAYFEIYVQANL